MSSTSLQLPRFAGHPWAARAYGYLPNAVAGLLVILIAWQLVQLTWLFKGSNAASGAKPIVSSVPAPSALPPRIDVQTIVNAHLFGIPEQQAADAGSAPPTQVALVLAGIMAVDDPQKGYAIVGESAAAAKVRGVGALLPGGVKLNAVYPDRVILEREGRLETLSLPRQTPNQGPIPRAAAPPNAGFAENLRQLAQNNPSAFGEVLRPQPVFANGAQRGYRVYPGRDRLQFAKLGLQPGDLVTAINGTSLDDPARGMEILNSMASSASVNVTVERNGQAQQLTLNTAQITLPHAEEATPPPAESSNSEPAEIQ